MHTPDADVVIVGAGIAGLTAGWRLVQAGHSVRIVEANNRTGGRLFGFQSGERAIQLGGRWTGPGQDRIKTLATELGVQVRANPILTELGADRFAEETARNVVSVARRLDEISSRVPLQAPWEAVDAVRLDSQTLATWLQASTDPQTAATLDSLLAGFLPMARDVSLLHAAFYLRSNGGVSAILGLDGPAHDSEMFEGGAHLMPMRLAERLGDLVQLGTPVSKIVQDSHGVTVVHEGGAIAARYAIVTLPPTLAGRLHYEPAMPPGRDYLTQRMPIRGKIVVALLYDEPFWRSDDHRLHETDMLLLWDEGGDEQPAALSGLVSVEASASLWALPAEQRQSAILRDLAQGFGAGIMAPREYHEIYWAAEPWSRGCNSFMTTGVWTAWGHALRAPVGRIHWAGAELSERFVGQMDGAVRSAEAAAATIVDQLRDNP